jgi:hypothetical protein
MDLYIPPNTSLPATVINIDGKDKEDFYLKDSGFTATSYLDWSASSLTIK